jgi:hypothetical protein
MPLKRYTVTLSPLDYPILDALASSFGIGEWRDILRALVDGRLLLTHASTPPLLAQRQGGAILLPEEDWRTLKRLCSAYELFNAQGHPSPSVLLHAVATGHAIIELVIE